MLLAFSPFGITSKSFYDSLFLFICRYWPDVQLGDFFFLPPFPVFRSVSNDEPRPYQHFSSP
jgi:hypothetical protein